MKIGIDIRTLMDERYSGVSEFVYHLLENIFKIDKGNEYVLFYNSYQDVSGRLPDFVQDKEIVNFGIPNKVYNYLLTKPFNIPPVDKRLDCDLLYLPHFNFTAVKDAPIIQTVHDLSFRRCPEFFSARKNLWHRALDAKGQLKRAKMIAAVSHSTKNDIIELAGVEAERVRVIYPGLNPGFRPLLHQDPELTRVREQYELPEQFLLFLGTIEPRKNVEGLIKAYAILDREMKGQAPMLVLAGGPGWKSNRIYRTFEASPAKDKIKFLGYVADADKCALYNLADIFIYPSFYEGFGFPPLEAMACGTPVIVGANSSLVEVAGNAGLGVDPYNASDIYLQMRELLTNRELKENLIAKGLERVKEFDWKKTAGDYVVLFGGMV